MTKRLLLILIALTACLHNVMGYSDHRNRKVDSLETVLRSGVELTDTDRLRIYLNLMSGYANTDGQKAIAYAEKAIALSYRLNALNARESAVYQLGLQAYGREDYDRAVDYFQWGLAVTDSMRGDRRYTPSDIDDNLSQLYGALGNLYNLQDKAHLAVAYYQRALPIFERHGWLESQTILYHNIGELYETMGNDSEAERNFLMAIEKATLSGDSLMVALAQKGLTKVYLGRDYDKARAVGEAAYCYYHAHRDEDLGDYTTVLVSLARLHMTTGHEDLPRAKAYAAEALSYADANLMPELRYDIYAANCEVAMAERQWEKALQYGLQSIHEDAGATRTDVGCYVLLAQIYTELGDKAQARAYINKIYNTLERSSTEHYQAGLSEMQVAYETEKKEAAIHQLEHQRRILTWGVALIAMVLLLTVLTFFLLWRSIRLNRQNALVMAKLEGEKEERVRLARDLHDRLGGILTALKLQLAGQHGEHTAAAPADAADMPAVTTALADEALREMRNVAHHLLPDSLSRHGLRTALREYCQTMKNVSFAFAGDDRHIDHEEAIYCIVYELVNNAVKSADADHIRVQMTVADDQTVINVSDDGRGLPQDVADEGMGLHNIRERVAAIGGIVDICSYPRKGTEFNIILPKA